MKCPEQGCPQGEQEMGRVRLLGHLFVRHKYSLEKADATVKGMQA